jgi:hypothetical protein
LRSHFEIEVSRGFDGHADAHLLAIDLLLTEELVLVHDAGRKLGLAQAGARCLEAEAIAVQVVAVGDRETHFDRPALERARREAERLLRLEQVIGRTAELELRQRRRAEDQQD